MGISQRRCQARVNVKTAESMIAPVPSHIDEADPGATAQAGRDPAEAVWSNLIPPPCYSVATMCLD
jgi:hypothetical protein